MGLERGRPRPKVGKSGVGGAVRRGLCGIQEAGASLGKSGPLTWCRREGRGRGPGQVWAGQELGRRVGVIRWSGTHWILTRDLEEADSRAHVIGDTALVAAAAVAGDGVEAQLGVVGGLGGDRDGRRRRQQLPFEAPHGRGDALGAASEERAAQEYRPAYSLAHILGAGLHFRRDWGRGRRSAERRGF